MKTVIARGPVGDESQLKEVADRMRTLTEARGGLALELSTEWRFVTGLGRSHPVENGFAWHHTLGTPYLPGSSIKGLVKAWVKSLSDRTNEEVEATWFGGPGQVGRVCFLDALPIKPVRLEVDVMTPHYAGWNPSNPPGDWMSPTPIPFLVVAPGACFLFCMIPQDSSLGAESLRAIRGHLTDALTWFGAGQKPQLGTVGFQKMCQRLRCLGSLRRRPQYNLALSSQAEIRFWLSCWRRKPGKADGKHKRRRAAELATSKTAQQFRLTRSRATSCS